MANAYWWPSVNSVNSVKFWNIHNDSYNRFTCNITKYKQITKKITKKKILTKAAKYNALKCSQMHWNAVIKICKVSLIYDTLISNNDVNMRPRLTQFG